MKQDQCKVIRSIIGDSNEKKEEMISQTPLWFIMRKVSNMWQKMLNSILQKHNLTHVQFIVMAIVFRVEKMANKALTQVQIATIAEIDVMMTSKVIRKLEAKWFLHRKEHETDARSKLVMLTQQGKELIHKMIPLVQQKDEEIFSSLPDQEEIKKMMHQFYFSMT